MLMKIADQMIGSKDKGDIHSFDIWVACLPKREGSHVQHGNRPVVVVSNDHHNTTGSLVTVVPLTSQRGKLSLQSHVYLSSHTEGQKQLACDSIALCEHVMTVDKHQLTRYIGTVSGVFERMAIQHALAVHLNMVA